MSISILSCGPMPISGWCGAAPYLDDLPTACVGMPVMPNGKTMEFMLKKFGSCGKDCEQQVAGMKQEEQRRDMALPPEKVGGARLEEAPTARRRLIDGPANLRAAPGGKIIGSFPDQFPVLLTGKKGDWFLIQGYWQSACETGWTHKSNLRQSPRR